MLFINIALFYSYAHQDGQSTDFGDFGLCPTALGRVGWTRLQE